MSSGMVQRGHWRPAEDAKLRELVAQHGPHNWNLIADSLHGRSGKSCRLRWFNQLDPRIDRRAFTDEDEARLLAAHGAYGNKWALIARRIFPGRTDNALKNHWHVIMARRNRTTININHHRHHHHSAAAAPPLACSGDHSTITTARDESVSACTDLSLNSRSRPIPCFHFLPGCEGNVAAEKCGGHGVRIIHQNMALAAAGGLDHQSAACSDTNSEASAAESVSVLVGESLDRERRDTKNMSNIPFFDFLGIGAS